jgi:hypothetical protein
VRHKIENAKRRAGLSSPTLDYRYE